MTTTDTDGDRSLPLVHPEAEGFADKIGPKAPGEGLHFNKCNQCGGVHFRHAGYIELLLPFLSPEGKKVEHVDHQVKVCVACKACHIWVQGQAYNVTDKIDLTAWERTEKEAHRATGPGGQC